MKRRIGSALLAFVLALSLLPVGALAETSGTAVPVTGGNIYFTPNDVDPETGEIIGGYWVTGCDSTVTAAEIPAEVDGVPVTSVADSAFKECTKLKSVTIPEGVTEIGESAFQDCRRLTSVTLPESLTQIGILHSRIVEA